MLLSLLHETDPPPDRSGPVGLQTHPPSSAMQTLCPHLCIKVILAYASSILSSYTFAEN